MISRQQSYSNLRWLAFIPSFEGDWVRGSRFGSTHACCRTTPSGVFGDNGPEIRSNRLIASAKDRGAVGQQ